MDKLVRQSRVAQLKTQRPMDLFKLNLYLTAWGAVLATTCFLYSDSYGVAATIFGAMMIVLALTGNAAIYMPSFPVRLAGYGINILFHAVVLVGGAFATLGLVLGGGLSPRLGARATVGILTVFYVLWYYNPFLRVIKTDRELQALRADEAAEKTEAADDVDVTPGWDQAGPARKGIGKPAIPVRAAPAEKPSLHKRPPRPDDGDLIP